MYDHDQICSKTGSPGTIQSRFVKPVVDYDDQDTGNHIVSFDRRQVELLMSNDSASNLSFEIYDSMTGYTFNFTLKPDEVMDERFQEFDSLTIVATGAWRYYTRTLRLP